MGGDEVVVARLDGDVAIWSCSVLAPLRHIACMPHVGSLVNQSNRASHSLPTCKSLTNSDVRCWLGLHVEKGWLLVTSNALMSTYEHRPGIF